MSGRTPSRPNVLLITLDQMRGDSYGAAGHPLVETPNLDRLAADGVRLSRHYSQAAPCGPGRACLYTGTYQMNNRVVGNGTPLDRRFDNVALAARRAGYEPALFGYTDQSIDPRDATGPDDPRLSTYEGILPGFDVALDLTGDHAPWLAWLADLGHDVRGGIERVLIDEKRRPAEHSLSTFMTDRVLDWLGRREAPWFAHLSYLRPHPPYSAAGDWSRRYDPADVGLPIAMEDDRHPLHDMALGIPDIVAPTDEHRLRRLRSQYFGMVSEVDAQLGRVWDALRTNGQWDDTIIVVTADHGEMLGDHGFVQKLGWWESSYHVIGIVRDPRHPDAHGAVVDRFTENVDLMPTLCEAMGLPVPAQCDGLHLTPLLRGEEPPEWRTAAHWEWDWREHLIRFVPHEWPWDRTLEQQNLAVVRTEDSAYVQFGDGTWRGLDLAADPTWRTTIEDPAVVLPLAQEMLTWRARHTDRTWASLLLADGGGIGRWPAEVPAWTA